MYYNKNINERNSEELIYKIFGICLDLLSHVRFQPTNKIVLLKKLQLILIKYLVLIAVPSWKAGCSWI